MLFLNNNYGILMFLNVNSMNQIRAGVAQQLPKIVSKPILLIPKRLQKHLISRVLQAVFQDALLAGDMDFLEGLYIKFEIKDCKLAWTYTYCNHILKIVDTNTADASIRCNLQEFVLLANRQVDPDTLFFQRRLIIEGDTELGLTMKNLMDTLDPDNFPLPLVKGLQLMEYLLSPK